MRTSAGARITATSGESTLAQGSVLCLANAYGECFDRRCLALQFEVVAFGIGVIRSYGVVGRGVQEDFPGCGLRRESCGNVGDIAERGEVFEAAATDVADELLAARDPNADVEPVHHR